MTTQTDKSLTIVDKSTRIFNAAAENIRKVLAEVQGVEEIVATLANDVEFKEDALKNLNQQFDLKYREQQAELRLKVKEDEEVVLNTLVKARKSVLISTAELGELHTAIESLKSSNEEEIALAVTQAIKEVKATCAQEVAALIATHQVEGAQHVSSIESLNKMNQFLTAQVTQLQNEASSERQARVSIAQAEANKPVAARNVASN